MVFLCFPRFSYVFLWFPFGFPLRSQPPGLEGPGVARVGPGALLREALVVGIVCLAFEEVMGVAEKPC